MAVDWSGRSSGAAESIWLARTDAEGQLVQLENGRDREALVDHLLDLAARMPRLVVGLDFAFGFPAWWTAQNGWATGQEVWQAMSTTAEALLAACEPPFWGRPNRPNPNPAARSLRSTDLAPAKSIFQIGGAGAVGTGSIRGMTQLARLSAAGFASGRSTRTTAPAQSPSRSTPAGSRAPSTRVPGEPGTPTCPLSTRTSRIECESGRPDHRTPSTPRSRPSS